jgi:hypothetical protein
LKCLNGGFQFFWTMPLCRWLSADKPHKILYQPGYWHTTSFLPYFGQQ